MDLLLSKKESEEQNVKSKKRKTTATVTAGALAVALALTGTFAWQSISQKAKNEVAGGDNPGGRLHDDFNGENKDIYVENFMSAEEGGQPIYARIRLDEYMETGKDAGTKKTDTTREATSLVSGAKIDDVTTWKTHKPNATDDPFHDYWTWEMGGSTIYMPTFNKNRDSLKADINGTYEGTVPDDATHFDDYHPYRNGETKKFNAVYDADTDNDIEEESPVENVNIKTVEETHTAKATKKAKVITMEEWKGETYNYALGDYWVYDVDGWAYWANPIQPGETTGLLLSGIEKTGTMNSNWYYGINAVAQFVTADSVGSDTNAVGFFSVAEEKPSADAMLLLKEATGLKDYIYYDLSWNGAGELPSKLKTGEGSSRFCINAFDGITNRLKYSLGSTSSLYNRADANLNVSIHGATSDNTLVSMAGVWCTLKIGSDETADNITLEFNFEDDRSKHTRPLTVTVAIEKTNWKDEIKNTEVNSSKTVSIDGMEWYVLAKENNEALLFSSKPIDGDVDMGSSYGLAYTSIRGMYPTVVANCIKKDITTRDRDNKDNFITENSDFFYLSEADFNGTIDCGKIEAQPQDYTYNGQILVTNPDIKKGLYTWLRSPSYNENEAYTVFGSGSAYSDSWDVDNYHYAAIWVNFGE